ncbi:unnamed protein product [Prunus armeniaca]|uniref:Uncharacterized protein n=1 Tax=Prunus armeniaca TaxID=36596 RepID=A0A6J5UHK1_PRUAR|nr:unnamed protein product [Prunus armeniaca]CAB4302309.1 unnamed protein product [Prunus armeniaca]
MSSSHEQHQSESIFRPSRTHFSKTIIIYNSITTTTNIAGPAPAPVTTATATAISSAVVHECDL